MRAYIDYEEDTVHKNDRAYICQTPASGDWPDDVYHFVKMDPKPYYIEYPEEQMEEKEKIKVRVNITGLDAETVADIIIILRDEGYEAVLEMDPKFQSVPTPVVPTYPYIVNDKWYQSPPIVTNVAPPVTNVYGSTGKDYVE